MIHTKKTIIKLAAYYEKILTDDQIEMYSSQLHENLTNEELSRSCKMYIDNHKNEFFPRPISKLIALIKEPFDSRDIAVEAASKIIEAVTKYGYSNETDAIGFIGELGATAVRRFGGWQYVCENLGSNLNLGTFTAQIRDQIDANIKINKIRDKLPTSHQIEQSVKNLLNFKVKEVPK